MTPTGTSTPDFLQRAPQYALDPAWQGPAEAETPRDGAAGPELSLGSVALKLLDLAPPAPDLGEAWKVPLPSWAGELLAPRRAEWRATADIATGGTAGAACGVVGDVV